MVRARSEVAGDPRCQRWKITAPPQEKSSATSRPTPPWARDRAAGGREPGRRDRKRLMRRCRPFSGSSPGNTGFLATVVGAYGERVLPQYRSTSRPAKPACATCAFRVAAICDAPSGARCPSAAACAALLPDEELVGRQHEDTDRSHGSYFAALLVRHHKAVVAWGCRMTGNLELAKDLAQEVFIKAFTRLDAFRGEARFTTWLFSITRNCCRDYAKARAARLVEVGGEALLVAAAPVAHNGGVLALETEARRALACRLMREARLTPLERRVMTLHYAYDVPLDALTARLRLDNRSGARAAIVSAKRKLRAAVSRWQCFDGRPFARLQGAGAAPDFGR
jgi:RNA polymerase sigma-70 factor, ECF subfamily